LVYIYILIYFLPLILDIVYRDQYLAAINKPHGLLVHRSPIAKDADRFAVQLLRDQVGHQVFPVHRLDRKTGGVLLFALTPGMHGILSGLFRDSKVKKTYLAIVRGHTEDCGTIDYPLRNERGKVQEAVTHYTTLSRTEIPYALENHPTQRYSLVEARPETGRMHQLRKHFSHIFHPIIGDRPHGCNKQNRFFKTQFSMDTLLLHALRLEFTHPEGGQQVKISAPLQAEFERMLEVLGVRGQWTGDS
jgi:tRNA pseudouridine65 synthase